MTDGLPIRTLTRAHRPGCAHEEGPDMPKYVIERTVPGAGQMDATALQAIAAQSNAVLQEMGPTIQWVQSFVTEDKITCVYIAPNTAMIREHARLGGFPADRVLEVAATIDPTTAESNELAAAAA